MIKLEGCPGIFLGRGKGGVGGAQEIQAVD